MNGARVFQKNLLIIPLVLFLVASCAKNGERASGEYVGDYINYDFSTGIEISGVTIELKDLGSNMVEVSSDYFDTFEVGLRKKYKGSHTLYYVNEEGQIFEVKSTGEINIDYEVYGGERIRFEGEKI